MATRMQQRRGTASQWTIADPVLAAGEIGVESDTAKFKIGDGVNAWSNLDYFETSTAAGSTFIEDSEKGANDGVATLDGTGNVPASQLGNVDLTEYATETYVNTAVNNLVDSAPGALDTLNELAAALGGDEDFATTVTNGLAGKSDVGHSHVIADVTNLQTELDGKAASSHTHNINEISQTVYDVFPGNTTVNINSTYVNSMVLGNPDSASGTLNIISSDFNNGDYVTFVQTGEGTLNITVDGSTSGIISFDNLYTMAGAGAVVSATKTSSGFILGGRLA